MSGVRSYAVPLPDGAVVHGRGRREPLPPGPPPTFGLCLGRDNGTLPARAGGWNGWTGRTSARPAIRTAAAAAIRRVHALAHAGERVEVTCGGGNGRTGTVIACLAVLSGVPADEAVAWTRAHYRRHAVETPGQRRWVRWFADQRPARLRTG